MAPQPQQTTELRKPDYEHIFLNVAHPSETKVRANKRLVRSHTTHWQHQKRREIDSKTTPSPTRTSKHLQRLSEPSLPDETSTPSKPDFRRTKSAPLEDRSEDTTHEFVNTFHPSQVRSLDNRKKIRGYLAREQHRKRRVAAAEADQLTRSGNSESAVSSPTADSPIAASPGSSSSAYGTLEDTQFVEEATAMVLDMAFQDENGQLLEATNGLGFPLRELMEHSVSLVYSQADAFQTDFGADQGWKEYVLPFVLKDPALVLVNLLVAVTHKSQQVGEKQNSPAIMLLHNCVINHLNQALREPQRAFSDQAIFCVCTLGAYEAIYGSPEVYHIHFGGLSRMVNARGGLEHLGSDGLLERMLLWVDARCASIVGSSPYLSHEHSQTSPNTTGLRNSE